MTASQCREHRWLARKTSKPIRSEKEIAGLLAAVERTALIEKNRSVVGIVDDNGREELDMTKDNLRLFVERWREHPDSPYTIDSYHVLPRNSRYDHDEVTSLRAHSPSPCDSLRSSSTQSVTDRVEGSGHLLSVPGISLSWERRASEGTAAQNRRDPASQIALAEEIIRLSEHLRTIALRSYENDTEKDATETSLRRSISRPGVDVGNNRGTYSKSNVTVTVTRNQETNEITEKLSTMTRQRKLKGTTFHSSRSFDRCNVDVNPGNLFVARRRTSVDGDSGTSERPRDREYSFERTTIASDARVEGKLNSSDGKIKKPTVQTSLGREKEDKKMDLTPPWRRSRVKRSFGETSRDVPRISNLRNLHKNLNLDEPGSAKDLLLHLLGEWEEVTATSCDGAGRKSVSLDWCTADTVARKTMNSLAEYFQSKQ